ncbi:hypothetical protein, partial [Agrobacterium tumefaciens]|uniref:hypothetical protein n=1 Tax=Agrobacterium tumefaciens TaxID=358 RepID=UPI001AED38A7
VVFGKQIKEYYKVLFLDLLPVAASLFRLSRSRRIPGTGACINFRAGIPLRARCMMQFSTRPMIRLMGP